MLSNGPGQNIFPARSANCENAMGCVEFRQIRQTEKKKVSRIPKTDVLHLVLGRRQRNSSNSSKSNNNHEPSCVRSRRLISSRLRMCCCICFECCVTFCFRFYFVWLLFVAIKLIYSHNLTGPSKNLRKMGMTVTVMMMTEKNKTIMMKMDGD